MFGCLHLVAVDGYPKLETNKKPKRTHKIEVGLHRISGEISGIFYPVQAG